MTIAFVVNVDWFFVSHRMALAKSCLNKFDTVYVITRDTGQKKTIENCGFKFIDLPINRKGINPLIEIFTIIRLFNIYRKIRPNIVHQLTIKPMVYGTLASLIFSNIMVLNAVTGIGYVAQDSKRANIINNAVKTIMYILNRKKKPYYIFQNDYDKRTYLKMKMASSERSFVIRGSGVNINEFKPTKTKNTNHTILLASRMLWDKGIKEFVKSSQIVKSVYGNSKFILAGKIDYENPNYVSIEYLKNLNKENNVRWIGYQSDMVNLVSKASIVVLPTSYGEGVPRVLIEAASMEKPIITTNTSGCKDIVKDGYNGIIIPTASSDRLADAIIFLLNNPNIMKEYGKNGRKLVIKEFSEKIVIRDTIKVYQKILNKKDE